MPTEQYSKKIMKVHLTTIMIIVILKDQYMCNRTTQSAIEFNNNFYKLVITTYCMHCNLKLIGELVNLTTKLNLRLCHMYVLCIV